jgi:RNA polymerase sigma factor (sigma-70 family)
MRKVEFERYLKGFEELLTAICRKYKIIDMETADIEQEVRLKLWKSRSKFNPIYKFNTWAFRVANNHIKDIIRAVKNGDNHKDDKYKEFINKYYEKR